MPDIRFTEPLIRRSLRRAVIRNLGPVFFVVLAIVAAVLVGTIANGERSWRVGAMATLLLLGTLFPAVAIITQTRAALERFRSMNNGMANIEISAGQVRIESSLGRLEVPLNRVSQVWLYPEYWVFLSGRSIVMTIPIETIPHSQRQAWLEELRIAGARVA